MSVETARRWLHHVGFEIITPRKGIFIDGHERDDVVEYRNVFLRRMVKIGFLHFTNAPSESSQIALPTDVDPPTLERRSKTVFFFHDESTLSANEDQNIMCGGGGVKGQKTIKPKSKGAVIMVSDFIVEHQGFLALTKKNTRQPRHQIQESRNMHVRSSSMVSRERAIGPEINLWPRNRRSEISQICWLVTHVGF